MIPNLTSLLSVLDQKITQSACLAFARLVDSFTDSDQHLQSICSFGMLPKLVALLRPGDREGRGFEVGTSTYTSIVKTLAVCCRGSPLLAVALLKENIISTVRSIIKKEEDERLEGNSLMAVVAVMRPVRCSCLSDYGCLLSDCVCLIRDHMCLVSDYVCLICDQMYHSFSDYVSLTDLPHACLAPIQSFAHTQTRVHACRCAHKCILTKPTSKHFKSEIHIRHVHTLLTRPSTYILTRPPP